MNYDGNYPYAGGEKGLYREETVPVNSLPPNAFGLYEMHGNVWEWCADGMRPYSDHDEVDPMGPVGEEAHRAVRRRLLDRRRREGAFGHPRRVPPGPCGRRPRLSPVPEVHRARSGPARRAGRTCARRARPFEPASGQDGRQIRGLLPGDTHGAGPETPASSRRASISPTHRMISPTSTSSVRAARLRRLLERTDDGETALGSDVMSAALEGYAMLKVSGKGAGLDGLQQGMSARFTRKAKIKALPAAA